MLEQGISALLSANPALSALIGTRLYPVLVPEPATYPCLSYLVVSGSSAYTFENRQIGLRRLQFDAWSNRSYADVKAVQQALRNALDGFQGTLGDGTRVLGTFRGLETDFYEGGAREYRVLQEYLFHFVEP